MCVLCWPEHPPAHALHADCPTCACLPVVCVCSKSIDNYYQVSKGCGGGGPRLRTVHVTCQPSSGRVGATLGRRRDELHPGACRQMRDVVHVCVAGWSETRLTALDDRRRAGGRGATACPPTAACTGALPTTCGRWGRGAPELVSDASRCASWPILVSTPHTHTAVRAEPGQVLSPLLDS